MTNIEKAIKFAVDGNYTPKGYNFEQRVNSWKVQALSKVIHKERFLLDPFFWQALGKSLKWDELEDGRKWESRKFGFMPVWLHQWHYFIDALAEGKTAEEAMGVIISSNK